MQYLPGRAKPTGGEGAVMREGVHRDLMSRRGDDLPQQQ